MEKTKQWEKAKELFAAALERSPSERGEFLREACGPDKSLLAELESLLSNYDGSEVLSGHPGVTELMQEAQPPQPIGPYRLVRKIGEGGMGQVWLAEQSAPLKRQVALKLIRAGMYDDALLRRFQAERQSLALMDHPAIAKVFDAGATADGQPYLVMEYVPGEPITDYCDRKKLSIRERLELFVKACEGVQHAHQKAIIHRDLKPANILVVEQDGKPAPRLIDFGLAKGATPMAAGESLFKLTLGFVGTPGYMSPEQTDPNAGDVDTRTDVYSLGVVLYELLTGLLPFDTGKWRKQPLDEVLRQLREQDTPRPSDRVQSDEESSGTAARLRGTELKPLSGLLRGDLDCITMKAIERDRARRYGTPSELAADINRYLKHEPVVARPASAGYRLQKYARRHRVAAGVAAGLVILLAAFAGLEAAQLRRMTRERDRANRIADFAMGMFKVSDPSEARGNTITAREILDKASKDIGAGLTKDPEMQAQMMYVMGKTYQGLGLYSQSETLFRKTFEIQQQVLGPDNPDTVRTLSDLGNSLMWRGQFAEAEKVHRQSLEILLRTVGPTKLNTAKVMSNLASDLLREGRYAEAGQFYRRALDVQEKLLGRQDPFVLTLMTNLGGVEYYQGHYIEAEKLERDTVESRRQVSGPNHPETLKALNNFAAVLAIEGRFREAEQLDRDVVDTRRRVLGAEHPDTLRSMSNLADVLTGEGRFAEAGKSERDVLDARRKIVGPQNVETLQTMKALAVVLSDEGQWSEGEKMESEAVEGLRRVVGPNNPDTLTAIISLAAIHEREGHYPEAERSDREALEAARRVLGAQSLGTRQAMNTLALALANEGHYAEAADIAKQALDIESQLQMPEHVDNTYSSYYLACIAAIQGQRDQAISLLANSIERGLWPEASLFMARDPDLKSLHSDPRFDALIAHAKERAAAAEKSN
jgi:non-specific serine/threonine protein kinase/serine/threonine-protein kinase